MKQLNTHVLGNYGISKSFLRIGMEGVDSGERKETTEKNFQAKKRVLWFFFLSFFFLFKIFIYLFMRDTEGERGRDTGRGRSRLHAGSLTWDLIPGLQDHYLSQRQMSNR